MVLAAERRAQILDAADRNGIVRIADLVVSLGVSDVTVRRDLEALARAGQLRKVRGGATLRRSPVRPGSARGPATGRRPDATHVGVLVPTAADYFRRIVDGIQGALDTAGARLTLSVSDYQPEREQTLVEGLLQAGADGLLLVPSIENLSLIHI